MSRCTPAIKNTNHTTIITGICGFVGSELARGLIDNGTKPQEIIGIDNLSRRGAWLNRESLANMGVTILHGDIHNASDLEGIESVDCVIAAAANANVMAGVDGESTSRQLVENNLYGTDNAMSLARLSDWCARRWGPRDVATDPDHLTCPGWFWTTHRPRKPGAGGHRHPSNKHWQKLPILPKPRKTG
jgi:nucleoside-diphosphate-sugar epimerase